MISITPVPIESDLCTTTMTFKQLDKQLDSAPIRRAIRQRDTDRAFSQTSTNTCGWTGDFRSFLSTYILLNRLRVVKYLKVYF